MDRTPKYLKMCERAFKDIGIIDDGLSYVNPEKIQNLWARLGKDGKYYRITQATIPEAEGWFQVYYQDQLQEKIEKYDLENLLVEFYCFISGRIPKTNEIIHEPRWTKLSSMEQFWLSFTMWEKHRKTWNDKKEKWE